VTKIAQKKVLHILSQRPSATGSGTTLDALVSEAAKHGWHQHLIFALKSGDPVPSVGQLSTKVHHPLYFESPELPFAIPGMSDVMPYKSTRFSEMTPTMVHSYRSAWTSHIADVIKQFQPDIIHSHHLWIVSSILKDIAPNIPVVTHSHGTGLRQMELCPHLADQVQAGCRRNNRIAALHEAHQTEIATRLRLQTDRIHVVSAGYREETFRMRKTHPASPFQIGYAGKLSDAKGVPWLLDAVEELSSLYPELVLHIAGAGTGSEEAHIKNRMRDLGSLVSYHGLLPPTELASLLQETSHFVLPSLYEGLPLVLAEAAACGNRLVCTELPGIMEQLHPILFAYMSSFPLPPLESIDRPAEGTRQLFVDRIKLALEDSFRKTAIPLNCNTHQEALAQFQWRTVFSRIESLWKLLTNFS
jgi:glycosyltransferase involved in cell wall biosynthesis